MKSKIQCANPLMNDETRVEEINVVDFRMTPQYNHNSNLLIYDTDKA